jgi:protein SCO1/2
LGLTGTPDQIEKVCKSYRVYFTKATEALGERDEDDYLVDHSIILYFMDPNGEFVEFYGNNADEQKITEKMKVHILNHLHPNKPSSWWSFK